MSCCRAGAAAGHGSDQGSVRGLAAGQRGELPARQRGLGGGEQEERSAQREGGVRERRRVLRGPAHLHRAAR